MAVNPPADLVRAIYVHLVQFKSVLLKRDTIGVVDGDSGAAEAGAVRAAPWRRLIPLSAAAGLASGAKAESLRLFLARTIDGKSDGFCAWPARAEAPGVWAMW
jgi:hypothetical protein